MVEPLPELLDDVHNFYFECEKYHVFFVGRRRSYVRDADTDPDFNEARP